MEEFAPGQFLVCARREQGFPSRCNSSGGDFDDRGPGLGLTSVNCLPRDLVLLLASCHDYPFSNSERGLLAVLHL